MAEKTSWGSDRHEAEEGRGVGMADSRIRDEALDPPMRSVWPKDSTSPRRWSDFGKAMAAQVLDRSGGGGGEGSVISAEKIQAIRGDRAVSSAVDGELSPTPRSFPFGQFGLDPKAQTEPSDFRDEADGPLASPRDRIDHLGSSELEAGMGDYAVPVLGMKNPPLEDTEARSTVTNSGQETSLNAGLVPGLSQADRDSSADLGIRNRFLDGSNLPGEFPWPARSIGSGGGEDLEVGTSRGGGPGYDPGFPGGEADSSGRAYDRYPDATMGFGSTAGPGQLSGSSGSPSAELSGLIRQLQQLLDELRSERRDFLPPGGREVYPAR